MPRIDPLQLLKCLGVLLTPNGGIRSKEEVQRLASLMMKFSKKLVSKCVYILILKNTEPELLGMFMSAGGWTLVLTWLSDGIYGKNWALVIELLELLLMCPVDVERLKSNSIPRLVKGLSKDEGLGRVNFLATKLVDQWLKIVKDETVAPDKEMTQSVVVVKPNEIVLEVPTEEAPPPEPAEEVTVNTKVEAVVPNQLVVMPQQFYKLTVRDGKQIIAKVGSLTISDNIDTTSDSQVGAGIDQIQGSSLPMTGTTVTIQSPSNTLLCSRLGTVNVTSTITSNNTNTTSSISTSPVTFPSTSTILTQQQQQQQQTIDKKDKQRERDRDRDKDKDKKDRSSKHEKIRHKSSREKTSTSTTTTSTSTSSTTSKDKNSSSKSKTREKERGKDRHRDRDKHRSNGSLKYSSSSSTSTSASSISPKDSKERQAEKDKDTLAKIQPKSVDKFGRIPKKTSSSDGTKSVEKKSSETTDKKDPVTTVTTEQRVKPSISIEVRKKDGTERPKTVKVFNSKLRSTGLEEAAKPPPPRTTLKKSPIQVSASKRPSPMRETVPLPEKRVKLVDADLDKPGGIKLIPAKPKPQLLLESDMFMDALAAATNKRDIKKRRRRISKDNVTSSPPGSPTSSTATAPLSPPLSLKSITAPKFYKDTLEADETKADEPETKPEPDEADEPNLSASASASASGEATPSSPHNVVKEVNGLRGVLVYHKRRKLKKTVQWRADNELEDIQYFELDENERVNVTKTFMDMKQMEHVGEREALQLSRKLPNEDLMDERTLWRPLIPIDLPPPLAEPGKKSTEKDIQFAREKVILQALYFNRSMLPDSPGEPDPEIQQITDPVPIPLDDMTGNPDSVNDFQNTPWPEPKGSPLHQPAMAAGPPPIFGIPPFNPQMGPPAFGQQFNNHGFMPPHIMNHGGGGGGGGVVGGGVGSGVGVGGCGGPTPGTGPGPDWRMPDPAVNMPPEMNHPPINPGPGIFGNRPDAFVNMMDDNSGPNNDMGGRGMGVGVGVGGFPHPGPGPGPGPGGAVPMQGPPSHPPGPGPMFPNPNYSNNQRGGNRGGFRNMGRGGWFRPGGPPPGWHRGGGNSHWGGRGGGICHQFKMHGFCRQRDTCPYMHPQPNQGQY